MYLARMYWVRRCRWDEVPSQMENNQVKVSVELFFFKNWLLLTPKFFTWLPAFENYLEHCQYLTRGCTGLRSAATGVPSKRNFSKISWILSADTAEHKNKLDSSVYKPRQIWSYKHRTDELNCFSKLSDWLKKIAPISQSINWFIGLFASVVISTSDYCGCLVWFYTSRLKTAP